jgi:hypothetical protein
LLHLRGQKGFVMKLFGKKSAALAGALLAGAVGLAANSSANASVILSWSSTASFAGTEASIPVSTYGSGIIASGDDITRANGLSGNAGAGSLNSAGWGTGYLTFSLTTSATGSYSLTGFQVDDRASGTGPGNLALLYSGNNFASSIGSWSDTANGTTAHQENVSLSPVVLAPGTTYTFRLAAANQSSNAGGTVGSTGTYRITSPTLELDGTAITVAVPEPASAGILGIAALGLLRRYRKSARI